MTFDEANAYLLTLPRFTDQGAAAYQPGLERMKALMQAMGRPQESYPSVHIAGSNGKGSTAAMLAAVATASGRRVGLHTSPHLFHVGERMRIDGVPAPESWIAGAVARFRDVMDALRPSYFEATTALSLLYFAEVGVDLAVIEVGLGGRLDATNILCPRLAIITNISLEHTDLLGETLTQIAREKGGIIKPNVPVLTAAGQLDVVAVLRGIAEERKAPFHRLQDETNILRAQPELDGLLMDIRTPVRTYSNVRVSLPGLHQQANAGLALRAAELIGDGLQDDRAIYAGLRDVRRLAGLRGRLEILHRRPLVLADVAHNPDGLAAALAFAQSRHPERRGRLFVAIGMMRDKDVVAMMSLLAAAGAVVLPVRLTGERALSVDEVTAVASRLGLSLGPNGTAEEAWTWFHTHAAEDDVLLITGSHQVVAQLAPVWPG